MKQKSSKYLITLLICLFVLLSNGCVRIYHYKKHLIKVVDAETNQPIEGALVSSLYLRVPGSDGIFISRSPKGMSTRTDASGSAKIKVATNSGIYAYVCNIDANGYIHEIPALRFLPGRLNNKNERIVTLYREPEPEVDIIVPDDYLGPVALQLEETFELIQGQPGQRHFDYKIEQNGFLRIRITPLLTPILFSMTNSGSNYAKLTFKRENGQEIPYISKKSETENDIIAFRRICYEMTSFLFVVGTEQDGEILYKRTHPEGRYLNGDIFNSYFKPETVR